MKYKLYGLAVSADKKTRRGAQSRITAGSCIARSPEEAIGFGTQQALKIFPQAEGWYNHGVVPSLIPHELIEQYMGQE